jgi:phosphoribosylformylglycinamidine synthase PurS subunit
MQWKARVEVSLKPGHVDPEGETTCQSLRELAYPITSVAVSKIYTIMLEANQKEKAESQIEEICQRLLANPTKDDFTYQVAKTE